MGKCTFCGVSAGWFKSEHPECVAHRQETVRAEQELETEKRNALAESQRRKEEAAFKLCRDAQQTLHKGGDLVALEERIFDAIDKELISHAERNDILIAAYVVSIDLFLDDGLLSDEEEQRLDAYQRRFQFSSAQLDVNGAHSKLEKSRVLKILMAGGLPPPFPLNGCAVNFQKGETPVWSFMDCQYMEDIVRRQIVGRSQGMSFRIMSGVYYRVGGFKGESVATVERKHLGPGELILTDRNLYFVGYGKTTRIPYSKIVSFTPFSDGFGLMRDAATAKPQFFLTKDGWFAYNLVTNLAKL